MEASEDVVGDSDVVFGRGTMVMGGVSVSEAELEPPIVWVEFEKGTLLGKLAICQHLDLRMEHLVPLTVCHFHHVALAPRS
jgi:hypothetical protein